MKRNQGYSLDKISKNLFIGDYFASINLKLLSSLGITHILVCGYELTCRFPARFKYLHLRIDDTPNQQISQFFAESFDFVDEGVQTGSVLIHCAQGRSRSVSFAVSFLMRKKNIVSSKALLKLQNKHPESSPNPGFIIQLQEYELVLGLR